VTPVVYSKVTLNYRRTQIGEVSFTSIYELKDFLASLGITLDGDEMFKLGAGTEVARSVSAVEAGGERLSLVVVRTPGVVDQTRLKELGGVVEESTEEDPPF
jgi:hypothetical protein